MIEKLILKMTDFYEGNLSDIAHFLKVHAWAREIGLLEGLDERTQLTLEAAAVVHDIACPLCREKYGSTLGTYQERESEGVLRPFLADCGMDADMLERVVYLVSHHHTTTGVDGIDYRILLEADFLVNADESHYSREVIENYRDNVFKTASGLHLLSSLYGV